MVYRTGYNPTDTPVVVDDEGRTIGGREWGTYQTTEDAAQAALSDGRLLEVEVPDEAGVNPLATAAHERTQVVQDRVEQVKPMDKPTLRDAAIESDLIDPSEHPHVSDLREVVAEHVEVPVPTHQPKKSTARKQSPEA